MRVLRCKEVCRSRQLDSAPACFLTQNLGSLIVQFIFEGEKFVMINSKSERKTEGIAPERVAQRMRLPLDKVIALQA